VAMGAGEADVDCLSLVLVDNEQIQELNRALLGADRPTDVIAFEAETGPDGKSEAEVYISVEQAALQADDEGHGLGWEMALLTVHAVLHALGHNDDNEIDRREMWQRQDSIMGQLEEITGIDAG